MHVRSCTHTPHTQTHTCAYYKGLHFVVQIAKSRTLFESQSIHTPHVANGINRSLMGCALINSDILIGMYTPQTVTQIQSAAVHMYLNVYDAFEMHV